MKPFKSISILVAIIIMAVIVFSSCTARNRRDEARTQLIQAPQFELSITYNDRYQSTHYCYAADKYDAERIFNDSLGIDTLSSIQSYTIKEIKSLNRHISVYKKVAK